MRSPKSSDMWTVTLVINFAMIINHMGDLLCKAALDMETDLATLFRMKNLEPCELRIYRIKITLSVLVLSSLLFMDMDLYRDIL